MILISLCIQPDYLISVKPKIKMTLNSTDCQMKDFANMSLTNGIDNNPETDSCPRYGIEHEDFRRAAHELVDRIIDYNTTVADRQTYPDVKPGFMRPLLPDQAPEEAENWPKVFSDIEKVIMKGMTHWSSSGFMAFFPAASSYPAVLGDMLSSAVTCIGFSWASSPSCTELETVMMDWLAKALNLPEFFLHNGTGPGGGVIQGTTSEAALVTMLSARSKEIRKQLSIDPQQSYHDINKRFVAYSSNISHSSVERAGKMALIDTRLLEADEVGSLRGKTLLDAIEKDKRDGRIPLYVCATIGTTACCTYDNLLEIGPICEREGIWLHIDAAYAGSALLCPEFRYIAQGIQYATSFSVNPHKWLMVNFDCAALWFKDSFDAINAMNVDPLYLRHKEKNGAIDYMHWQIPTGRKFRAIKLWFVLRMVGLKGLRSHIRRGVAEAQHFKGLVEKDKRFKILFPVTLGLVCIRLKKDRLNDEKTNEINRKLFDAINADRRFFVTPSSINGKFFIRIVTGAPNCSTAKLDECWAVVREISEKLLATNISTDNE